MLAECHASMYYEISSLRPDTLVPIRVLSYQENVVEQQAISKHSRQNMLQNSQTT